MIKFIKRANFSILCFVALSGAVSAQTNGFTYQGKLTDPGAMLAMYDFEFRLCDSLAADCSAPLAAQQLSPRQPITSAPYAIKSSKSFNAENRGGLAANTYLQTTGDGSNLRNVAKLHVSNVFTGSGNIFPQVTLSGDGQIIAPRLENSAADPATAAATNAGRIYFNTTDNAVKVSNGTAWVSLTPQPRRLSIFTAAGSSTQITCSSNIRSIPFNKVSASSRLRITYKDEFAVLSSSTFSAFRVEVRIDNATTSPVSMTNQFGVSCSGGLCSGGEDDTFVGYADGIAAGAHTFTSVYTGFITGSPICYRPAKYLVEIEEIP